MCECACVCVTFCQGSAASSRGSEYSAFVHFPSRGVFGWLVVAVLFVSFWPISPHSRTHFAAKRDSHIIPATCVTWARKITRHLFAPVHAMMETTASTAAPSLKSVHQIIACKPCASVQKEHTATEKMKYNIRIFPKNYYILHAWGCGKIPAANCNARTGVCVSV